MFFKNADELYHHYRLLVRDSVPVQLLNSNLSAKYLQITPGALLSLKGCQKDTARHAGFLFPEDVTRGIKKFSENSPALLDCADTSFTVRMPIYIGEKFVARILYHQQVLTDRVEQSYTVYIYANCWRVGRTFDTLLDLVTWYNTYGTNPNTNPNTY